MIHKTADIQTNKVGSDTNIWQFVVILEGAQIGNNCNINCHVFIENDVIIGNNVTIKSGVQLWDGLRVADNVFIGPNVTFTNDKRPRSKEYPDEFQKTTIMENASIGAGATLLGGIEIGKYAMVGAGSVVTKSVPSRALVVGNPSKIIAWLNQDGSKMRKTEDFWIDSQNRRWKENDGKLILV